MVHLSKTPFKWLLNNDPRKSFCKVAVTLFQLHSSDYLLIDLYHLFLDIHSNAVTVSHHLRQEVNCDVTVEVRALSLVLVVTLSIEVF